MLSYMLLQLGFLAAFNMQTLIKLLIIAALSPFWWPIARAMRHEVTETLAPDGGLLGNKEKRAMQPHPPGLDPFVNVPRSRHRQHTQRKAAPSARQPEASREVLTPQSRRQREAAPLRPSSRGKTNKLRRGGF